MGMGRGIIMIDNGGEGMDNVRPISEFLNNPKLVEKMALESDEPIYFEGEGRQKIAVWRVVEPDDCWTDEELAAAADAAHEEYLRTGISYSFDEVKAKLRKMLDE